MKKFLRKALNLLVILALVLSSFTLPENVEAAETPDQEIEVTLAADTASNNLDLTGFSDKLKSRLNTTYGVPLDKIHVTAVDSAVVSSSINWYRFDHTNYLANAVNTPTSIVSYVSPTTSPGDTYIGPGLATNYTLPTHVITSGTSVDFYGYGVPAFKDFLFTANNNTTNKVFSFLLNEQLVDYHTAEGVGFLFNAKYVYNSSSDRRLSGYMVLIGASNVYLYRLDNIEIGQFMNSSGTILGTAASVSQWGGTVYCLKTIPKPATSSGTYRYLKLAASPTAVSFYQFTDNTYSTVKNKILDNEVLTTTYNTFGFGPIACYTSHGCQVQTHVTFSNLAMSEDTSVSFTDLVKNTTWNYAGSFRVIANVDNDGVPDFANKGDLATNLYYMMQNSTHYVGWGINNTLNPAIGSYSTVKDQSDGFVSRNNDRGTFINRSDSNYDSLDEGTAALADYIANQLELMPIVDKPVINTTFNANFLSNGSVTCSTPTVTTSLGNTVDAYQWQVMDVQTGTWSNQGTETSTSLTFATNTYNIVSLRVKDPTLPEAYSWSDYAIAYIANDTSAPPVSLFTLDKSELMPDTSIESLKTSEVVQATDSSYHPAGEAITNWEWKVYNSTLVEQTGLARTTQNPSFDFTGKASGKYTIKLRVKKGAGNWSAYYSQSITVFRESDSIDIVRTNPTGTGNVNYTNAPQAYSFDITSSADMTGYRIIKIPASGINIVGDWTTINGKSASISSSISGGSCEIFVQVKDVNGNSKTQSLGVFTQGSAPEVITTGYSDVGGATATVSGYVYSADQPEVTARGVEYKADSDVSFTAVNAIGAGTGDFNVKLTGLASDTDYIAKAFATNSVGTSYGEEVHFKTTSRFMSAEPEEALTEENLDGMSISLFLLGESFKDDISEEDIILNNAPEGLTVTEVVYAGATNSSITLDFDGTHFDDTIYDFSITVAGSVLSGAVNITSDDMTIMDISLPEVSSFILENDIGSISATVRGTVSSTGGAAEVERGIEYKLASDLEFNKVEADNGAIGDFSIKLVGLTKDADYVARAYAANSMGTSYGEEVQFTTNSRSMSAEPGEELTEENLDGMSIFLSLVGDGFRDDISENDIALNNAPDGLTVAEAVYEDSESCSIMLDFDGTHFDEDINNFYITIEGSALKENMSIDSDNMTITNTKVPTVATTADFEASGVTATVRGTVISTGGTETVSRGIKFKKTSDSEFTTADAPDGGTGDFSVRLTGLSPNTQYIVKAFASNRIGMSYGESRTIVTTDHSLIVVSDNLKKENLNGTILNLTLTGDSFKNNMGVPSIKLNNAPIGLEVASVERQSSTSCKVRLAFDGDFDISINNFYITVKGSSLNGGSDIDSNYITIQASDIGNDTDTLDIVYADYDNIAEENDDNAGHVTRALYLPVEGKSGKTKVTWASDKTDVITNTGRVTRPEPGEEDINVILTATITEDWIGGIQTTKQFPVKVLALSDEEAANDAARKLTVGDAFDFDNEAGDTWECITKEFFAVTTGDHSTTIEWESSSNIITLEVVEDKVIATVTRPSDSNANVILRAKITKGDVNVIKPFLLVVQKEGVNKPIEETRQDTGRTAEAAASSESASFSIERTVLDDEAETKIDYILVDTDTILSLTEEMNPQSDESLRTVIINMKQDSNDRADQLAIEIPASAISAMADRNAVLEVNTDEGSIRIEQSILQKMSEEGTDLFFRIVPVNDIEEQSEARSSARNNTKVIQLASGGKQLSVLGIPRRIETNYMGYRTKVILPLAGITIPTEGRDEFLNSLRVFIEHSESTELLTPVIVYDNDGIPTGVEFEIEEFSRFQIVRAVTVERKDNDGDTDRAHGSFPVVKPTEQTVADTEVTIGGTKLTEAITIEKSLINGDTNTKMIINNEKFADIIKNGKTGEVVGIVSSEPAKMYEIEANAELLKLMQTKKDIISITTPEITWNIPVASINIDGLYDKLGKPNAWKDVNAKLVLNVVAGDKLTKIQSAIRNMGAQMQTEPMECSIIFSYMEKDAVAGLLNQYSEMMMLIPEGIDPLKITTGVYVSDEMRISHVPTEVTVIAGKYYAKINSLYADGIHTVIWGPKEFPDVARHWSKTDTNDAYSRMIVFGDSTGQYRPDMEITRGEFAAILTRGLGLRPIEVSSSFSDVSKDEWYYEVINTASAFNLIKGYGDETFMPDKKISREEAMTIIYRAMSLTGLKDQLKGENAEGLLDAFNDMENTADWAKDAAAACVEAGIIAGRGGNRLEPKNNVTRAEVAAIVERLLEKSNLIED